AVALVTTDGDGSAAPETRRVCGLLALDTADLLGPKFVLFHCARVVYATGGPAGLYADSVYPPSQTGATGIALEAGAPGQNLTEWQYGIASTRFRWNLSGTYQQVLPRYLSTAPDGSDAREFLREYFDSDAAMLSAVFLKGYQWPFDPRKLDSGGSSIVDIAVHRERCERGRRVFLDYRSNPQGVIVPLSPGQPAGEAYEYLARSGALGGMPIDRLRIMNPDAIRLYASHGIDLANEPLEIAVCAQHNNGGLTGDIWWESPLRGLYPVGEANGSFGVYRPGGSALNETQAGSRRAAQRIAREGPGQGVDEEAFFAACLPVVRHRLALTGRMLEPENDSPAGDAGLRLPPGPFRRRLQRRMSDAAGFLRDPRLMRTALAACLAELADPAAGQRAAGPGQLAFALRNYDLLIAQAAYLGAMLDAAEHGTGSRGSCLVIEEQGDHACAGLRFRLSPEGMDKTLQVCEMRRVDAKGVDPPEFLFSSVWTPVRPIPPDDQWFENDWSMYRSLWRVSTKEEESC
ncbi:MAG TPA: FAD-binding protein, partial [Clostridia bacterium]